MMDGANVQIKSCIDMPIIAKAMEWFEAHKVTSCFWQVRRSSGMFCSMTLGSSSNTLGGPRPFLETVLTSPEHTGAVAARLDQFHTSTQNLWDKRRDTVNSIGSTALAARISDIYFGSHSAIKPPTFQKVVLHLVDEFALNGFLDREEPVQVWLPTSVAGGGAFQLHLVKGAARCYTLHAMSLHLQIMNRPLNSKLPVLFASLTSDLTLVAPLVGPSLELVAFRNAQL